MVRGHANAGVDDAKGKPTPGQFRRGPTGDLEADRSPLGELAGVGKQVEQALADLGEIVVHVAEVFRALDLQPVGVLVRQRLDRGHDVPDHGRHVKSLER